MEFIKANKKLIAAHDYYLANKKEILKKYRGKYVVIENKKIIGSGTDSVATVKRMMKKGHTLGEFLVHLVVEKEIVYSISPLLTTRSSKKA